MGPGPETRRAPWRVTLMLGVLAAAWTALPSAAGAEPANGDQQSGGETEALVEELGRALGMTPAEIESLGLSPAEMRGLLAGFAEETVVVGSRAQLRSATESAVPVDVLSAKDLVSRGAGDLKDQLRTIIPSFSVNSQPISGGATVVRPAMLRNLAPDHTLLGQLKSEGLRRENPLAQVEHVGHRPDAQHAAAAVFPRHDANGLNVSSEASRRRRASPAERMELGVTAATTTSRSFPRGWAVAGAETLTATYCLPSPQDGDQKRRGKSAPARILNSAYGG